MSAAAPSISASPAEADPGPLATAAKPAGKLRFLGRNFWALGDQVLISGTNFVTLVLTAWALDSKVEFGRFSTIYSILLFCNILPSTLITQAHNVIGATRDGRRYRTYTASTAVQQLGLIALQVGFMLPVAMIDQFFVGGSWAPLVWALIPAVAAWQLQEFVRRVLYTEERYGAAFVNDIVSYGGQTLVLAAMYVTHKRFGNIFNGQIALYVLAATSAAAVAVGVWQLRGSLIRDARKHDMAENWHFGKWLLGGELLAWASSLHMQVLWAAVLLGTAASADLRAAQILFGPTRAIAFFLGTILPIRFARVLHEQGVEALNARVRSIYRVMAPLVGAYCLILILFPRQLLRLIYGNDYSSSDAVAVLVLYAICAFLTYMQMVMAAALTASRQTRLIFTGNVWGCVIALMLSPVCIRQFGAAGGVISMMATTMLVTALYVLAYRKHSARGFPVLSNPAAPAEVSA